MGHWGALATYLLFALVSGCASPESTSQPAKYEKNTIFFATHMGEHPGWVPAFQAIARRYEAMHPGWKVRLHYQPLDGYQVWAETQFISGKGPDILDFGGADAFRFGARMGLLVPLTEQLYSENPYAPGKRWKDTFYPIVWKNSEDPIYGELWWVPFNFFAVRIFYNKDLFARAGIQEPPRTWREFMVAQQKLLDAGIVPYLMPNSSNTPHKYVYTCMEFLSDMLYQDRVQDVDKVYRDGQVDGIESNISIYNGKTRLNDPQMLAVVRLLKDWSRYWVRGYNGLDRQQAKMLFANGIGAMYMDGSWETEGLAESVDFQWGVFPMPTLTKETTPFADGPRNDNNYNLSFSIGKVAERRGHLAQVVDFLQYLTGPEAADTLSHYVTFISTLEDYPIPEKLQAFAPATGHPWSYNPWAVSPQSASMEAGDILFSLLQGYFAGSISERELTERYGVAYHALTIDELRFALRENAKRVIDGRERLLATRSTLDSLQQLSKNNPNSSHALRTECARLKRVVAFQEESLSRANAQFSALLETLSRPPVWERRGSEAGLSEMPAVRHDTHLPRNDL
jgi:ABC-type glycerol-3-phosphate transport system substrate-binding protein